MNDVDWMRLALAQAEIAQQRGEVPVGAVLVADDTLLAEAYNMPITSSDPTAHAEVAVLRSAAAKLSNYRLPETTLYVTIEPCTMCMGALIHARVRRLVFGAREPRAGAAVSQLRLAEHDFYNHRLEVVEGVLAEECSRLMSDFFRSKRKG